MSPLVGGAAAGVTIAAGLILVWRGLNPARPALVDVIRNADRAQPKRPENAYQHGLNLLVTRGTNTTGLHADLAVMERSVREFAGTRLAMSLAFGGLPVFVAVLTSVASGARWNPAVIGLAAAAGMFLGFVISRGTLASEATERRHAFVCELAAYLDIVSQLLAGGAGVDDALWRAARNAQSPGIMQIRDALGSAKTRRRSQWSALGDLATTIAVPELLELVTAVQLAGTSGAKVRASLTAKAHALRDRTASQQLASAQRSSERMGGPLIAMLLAFLVLIIAPALAAVMAI